MDQRLKQHELGYWEVVDRPSPAQLQAYYANKYYQQAQGSYELVYGEGELAYFRAKLEQRRHVIDSLQPRLAGPGQHSMLDVGCGEGHALAYFSALGWNVRGLDFSSAGVDSQHPACRDKLLVGNVFDLLDIEISAGQQYDVVWLQNVLEHVLDPIGLMHSLRRLVAPGGVAVVTVPNDCSIVQQAAMQHGHIDSAFWVMPPDHLSYFDSAGLSAIAAHTGWHTATIMGDFPVDWLLFHSGSNYARDKSRGKEAHHARVQIENLIHAQPVEAVVKFWAAAGSLGIGRNITAFLLPEADRAA